MIHRFVTALLFDEGEREMMHYFEGTRQRPRLETTEGT